jgi:hypothetical protein
MLVGELRKMLEQHEDDAQILCQVVGSKSGAWNMLIEAHHGKDRCFKWEKDPLLLTLKHPDIEVLPDSTSAEVKTKPPSERLRDIAKDLSEQGL